MSPDSKPQVFIHREILVRLEGLGALSFEVGGWLLGYWGDDHSSAFITHVTPPFSVGTAHGVRIDGAGHGPLFDQTWERTGGLVTYLGDWHTHPDGPPLPSQTDREALAQLRGLPAYGTDRPLMLIASTPQRTRPAREFRTGLYMGSVTGEPVPLDPVVEDALPEFAARVPIWTWPRLERMPRCSR